MYHHITRDKRIALSALLRAGHSQSDIAKQIKVDKSAVSRELSRNKHEAGIYHAGYADKIFKQRRHNSKIAYRKIESNPGLAKKIEEMLDPLTSPEVVAHELGMVHETIYAWIGRSRPDLYIQLPQRGKKRRRYGSKRNIKQGWTKLVRPIDIRPQQINQRTEVGHFEGDTVRGINGCLLVHADMKSRYYLADKMTGEKCDETYEKTKRRFKNTYVKTITYDRGSSFSLWKQTEKKIGADIYFAHPHAPHERGTCENTNGRLRRVFPKKFDFSTITQKEIEAVVWKMNHTRRKCLNWHTPCEVFGHCCTSS